MKGKIIRYFEEKGYGFIKDEEGESRFFHITDVINTTSITLFSDVAFDPSSNNKGGIAKNIKVIEAEKIPKFIIFGDVRIKLSNIKSYGMDVNKYTNKRKLEESSLDRVVNNTGTVTALLNIMTDGIIPYTGHVEAKYEEEIVIKDVLYVTTYQGDNYRFEDGRVKFNINSKLKELDKYLS